MRAAGESVVMAVDAVRVGSDDTVGVGGHRGRVVDRVDRVGTAGVADDVTGGTSALRTRVGSDHEHGSVGLKV